MRSLLLAMAACVVWAQPVLERVLGGNAAGSAGLLFSADGTNLTVTAGGRARVFDTRTGELLRTEPMAPAAEKTGRSDDGCITITALSEAAQLRDVCRGRTLALVAGNAFFSGQAAMSGDGRRVLTAGGGRVRIYRSDSAKPVHSVPVAGEVVAVTKDLARLAVWGPGGLGLFDARTGRRVALLAHGEDRAAARFSADGRWVVTIAEFTPARLWDARDGKAAGTLGQKNASFATMAPDRAVAALAIGDGTAELWRLP